MCRLWRSYVKFPGLTTLSFSTLLHDYHQVWERRLVYLAWQSNHDSVYKNDNLLGHKEKKCMLRVIHLMLSPTLYHLPSDLLHCARSPECVFNWRCYYCYPWCGTFIQTFSCLESQTYTQTHKANIYLLYFIPTWRPVRRLNGARETVGNSAACTCIEVKTSVLETLWIKRGGKLARNRRNGLCVCITTDDPILRAAATTITIPAAVLL